MDSLKEAVKAIDAERGSLLAEIEALKAGRQRAEACAEEAEKRAALLEGERTRLQADVGLAQSELASTKQDVERLKQELRAVQEEKGEIMTLYENTRKESDSIRQALVMSGRQEEKLIARIDKLSAERNSAVIDATASAKSLQEYRESYRKASAERDILSKERRSLNHYCSYCKTWLNVGAHLLLYRCCGAFWACYECHQRAVQTKGLNYKCPSCNTVVPK